MTKLLKVDIGFRVVGRAKVVKEHESGNDWRTLNLVKVDVIGVVGLILAALPHGYASSNTQSVQYHTGVLLVPPD